MTAQNRSTLKGVFEDGDVPTGSDYANLIDSFVSLTDSTAQTVTSDLQVAKLIATTEVSAETIRAQQVLVSAGSTQEGGFGFLDAVGTGLVLVSADTLGLKADQLNVLEIQGNSQFSNGIKIIGASAGGAVLISAKSGATANVGMQHRTKGSGSFIVDSSNILMRTQDGASEIVVVSAGGINMKSATLISPGGAQALSVSASSVAITGTLFVEGNEVTPAGAGAEAEMFITATASTSIGSAGTFEIINGVFSAESTFLTQFETSTNGQATYIGSNTKTFQVLGRVSSRLTTGTNKDIEFRIAKNGTTLSKSATKQRLANATDIAALSVGAFVSLVCGDTVDLRIANQTDTTDIVVHTAHYIVVQT